MKCKRLEYNRPSPTDRVGNNVKSGDDATREGVGFGAISEKIRIVPSSVGVGEGPIVLSSVGLAVGVIVIRIAVLSSVGAGVGAEVMTIELSSVETVVLSAVGGVVIVREAVVGNEVPNPLPLTAEVGGRDIVVSISVDEADGRTVVRVSVGVADGRALSGLSAGIITDGLTDDDTSTTSTSDSSSDSAFDILQPKVSGTITPPFSLSHNCSLIQSYTSATRA
eukprot:scaffold14144_cov91-Skeletonema_dohrnii-CCMP3373.AAC.8